MATENAARTSESIPARVALALKPANCGIAMAAKIPMIATTIINSIKLKPFLFWIFLNMGSSLLFVKWPI